MKNFLLTVIVALLVGAAAFTAMFFVNDEPALHRAARESDAMTWLRTEFALDDAHFEAIRKLHEDYGRVCGEHCAAINAAKERHATATEIAALERTCVDAMTAHFHRVAALMPAKQGERYLATVLPRIARYDHAG